MFYIFFIVGYLVKLIIKLLRPRNFVKFIKIALIVIVVYYLSSWVLVGGLLIYGYMSGSM